MLRIFTSQLSTPYRCVYRRPRPLIVVHFYRNLSTAMATPSPSHLNDAKKPKEKMDKMAAIVSQYPVEVSTIVCARYPVSLMHIARKLQPRPDYIDHRIKMFEQLQGEYDVFVKCGWYIGFQPPRTLITHQPNSKKKSRSRCQMVPSAMAPAG